LTRTTTTHRHSPAHAVIVGHTSRTELGVCVCLTLLRREDPDRPWEVYEHPWGTDEASRHIGIDWSKRHPGTPRGGKRS